MTVDEAVILITDARAEGKFIDPESLDLTDEDRREVTSLVDVADLLWESAHGAPPINQDPVAKMLGLTPKEQG